MKYSCMIIDDEPLAIEAIEMLLDSHKDFEITVKCSSAVEAISELSKNRIDLIFLDIQMPRITGIEFAKALTNPPPIIITSAYSEHAVEGFNLNVLDYLLKPISPDRFLKAIDKFFALEDRRNFESVKNSDEDEIFIKADRKISRVKLNDILYIEGLKDYVTVHLTSSKIITKNSLSNFDQKLPAAQFIRCHRSFIVNKNHIHSYSNNTIEIGTKEIPVSKTHFEDVKKFLSIDSKLI